ncbi:MAG: type II secretion system protein N [Azonexus sp.]|nr:type II secretion system protein N [Azonexus sp.]MDP3635861.1 type II secretion system protein N [Azonexus sp.]
MPSIPNRRPSAFVLHHRLVQALAWCLAIGVGAWEISEHARRYSAPGIAIARAELTADPNLAATVIASRHLMGEAAAAEVALGIDRLVLVAAVTGTGGQAGWALIANDGGPQQVYFEGEQVSNGVMLESVAIDYVMLSSGGIHSTLKLSPFVPEGGKPSL